MKRAATPTAAGEPQAAAELGRDAVDRAVAAVGAGHVLAVNLEAGLAQDLRVLGRTAEADEREGRALAALSASHGPDHPQTLYMRSRARPYWDFEGQPI
ncbi:MULTISPECIES: hypothetical protein [unclassified Streptomyces]|uniref:hypothetical protein n=1 Tax=unclassified Streptomyces TaxID=2593676 RepID=UPI0038101387